MKQRRSRNVRLARANLSIGAFDVIRFSDFAHAFPRHAHEHYTIGVFDTDQGTIRYRGADWNARTGNILMIPGAEVHAAWTNADAGWTYRALYPTPEIVAMACDDFAQHDGSVLMDEPIIENDDVAREIRDLHTALENGRVDLEVESRLLLLVRTIIGRYAKRAPQHVTSANADRAVAIARDYLEAHYREPVRLDELARTSGLSQFHLLRCFRARYGLPPHAYLTQIRAARARTLLVEGQPITSVAYSCGFADQSHLTRVLRSLYGVTPGVIARHR